MIRVAVFILFIVSLSTWFPCETSLAVDLTEKISGLLKQRIEHAENGQKIICKSRLLCSSALIPQFYKRRNYQPAWSSIDGPNEAANNLARDINDAELEGLRPEDYHLSTIKKSIADIHHSRLITGQFDTQQLADLDLLLTDAFFLFASHMVSGRVNPETIRSEWFIKSEKQNLIKLLETTLNHKQIERSINRLRHQNPGYDVLRQYLTKYIRIMKSGGWPEVPPGPMLRKRHRGSRVNILRSRLTISGDLDVSDRSESAVFDGELETAVKKFQKRHGLRVDGMVGPNTLKALNVTVIDRIEQIKANMERLRWIPNDIGRRYVLVNIASFSLDLIENEEKKLSMRVVVGKKSRGTPVFKSRVTHFELNPYWNIPPKIASEDILPKILKDEDYLEEENIKVFKGWGKNAPEIDSKLVTWSRLSSQYFPYKLRQEPGIKNAMGRIKFFFPNRFDVYLHDTPARGLFNEIKRDFSSGCIRIEKPIELAGYLLNGDRRWNREKILRMIDEGRNQKIWLSKPIDIYMLYLTAWADKNGIINFRDDIYERDTALKLALEQRPPFS